MLRVHVQFPHDLAWERLYTLEIPNKPLFEFPDIFMLRIHTEVVV